MSMMSKYIRISHVGGHYIKQERTLERKNRPGPGYVRIIGSFKDIIGT